MVLTNNTQSFKQVLLIEYPRKGIYSMCFQTAGVSSLGEIQQRTGEDVICVFVPTTPNPTSGFIMFVPKQEVIVLDMAVEDAVKMVVSLGVVVPPSPAKVSRGVQPAASARGCQRLTAALTSPAFQLCRFTGLHTAIAKPAINIYQGLFHAHTLLR